MSLQLSRRSFLRSSGLLGAGLAFGLPVLKGSATRASAQDAIVIDWWDHYGNLPELQNALWTEYSAAHPNVKFKCDPALPSTGISRPYCGASKETAPT